MFTILFTILSTISINSFGVIDTAPIADVFYNVELYFPPERARFADDICYRIAAKNYNDKGNWTDSICLQ